MQFDVNGKVALVTGANRGIGRAITEALLDAGAGKVYAAVRTPQSAEPLVAAYGPRVVPVRLDLADAASCGAAAAEAADVDLLVNNGGVYDATPPLAEEAIDRLAAMFDVNVYGLLRLAHAFAPVLKANGGGALVQLNSVVSLKGWAASSTYCASKAAAYSLTQSLREQLMPQGTHVLSVHPGPIATDMGNAAGFGEIATSPQGVATAIVAALGRGDFHCWPDPFAATFGAAYADFATQIIESDLTPA